MVGTREDSILVSNPRPEVLQLTLNRSDRLNALTADMVDQLHTHLGTASLDPDCRAIVLTGAGRGFCAGLDLDGYGEIRHGERLGRIQRAFAEQRHIASLVQEIRRLPQPVIAAINGPAAGGGLALVCACDVRLAAANTMLTTSFSRTGVTGCDIGTSWLLPRIVGAGRAHELMLTSRRVDAAEAAEIGLIAAVVAAPRNSCPRSNAYWTRCCESPPMSLSLTKQAMWLALEIPSLDAAIELENRQQVLTYLTEDRDECMSAYRTGRTPHYGNR